MKRIATMQDLSCLGKCSLTVIHPVISAMGVECGVLPTAVLSTHTAFPNPAVTDLSGFAGQVMDHWETLGVRFDTLLTGYLANPGQAMLAKAFFSRFAAEDTKIIVDPAMGDHGKLYSGLGQEMVQAMRELCRMADLCIPNLTEAALLTQQRWEDRADPEYCRSLAGAMLEMGCRAVLITGAEPEPGQVGCYYRDGEQEFCLGGEKLPRTCHGTGDLFAAVVAGGLTRGLSPQEAAELAMEFIRRAISATEGDSRWGVAFEGQLGWLANRDLPV